MPHAGQTLIDPRTGARLRFLEVSTPRVVMELEAPPGWTAGPLHVHPSQTERITVLDGAIRRRLGRDVLLCGTGDEIRVPPGVPHTVENAGDRNARLQLHFEPRLRTAELFEEMFGGDGRSRPPGWLPSPLRAWLESRGYEEEIRYLWPRVAAGALGLAALTWTAWRSRASRRD